MTEITDKVIGKRSVEMPRETMITEYSGSKFFVEIGKQIHPDETNENVLGRKGCNYFMKNIFERSWFIMFRKEKVLSKQEIINALSKKEKLKDVEALVETYLSDLTEKKHPRGYLGFYELIVYLTKNGLYHFVDHFDG